MIDFSTLTNKKEPCKYCENRGYNEYKTKDEMGMQTFCACENGSKLRSLVMSFRITDMHSMVSSLLPKIQKAKENLIKPTEAGKGLDEIIKELEETDKKLLDATNY